MELCEQSERSERSERHDIERLLHEYMKATGSKEDDIIMFIGNAPVTAKELIGNQPYKDLLSSIAKNTHF